MIAALAVLLAAGPVVWTPRDIQWTDLPMIPEARSAVLWGDPTKEANGQLKRFPGGAEIPTHKHSQDQRMLVVQGTLLLLVEDQPGRELEPGSFSMMPAGTVHGGICKRPGPCIVYEEQPGASDFIPAEKPAPGVAAATPASATAAPTPRSLRAKAAPDAMGSRRTLGERQAAVELLWERFTEATFAPEPYASVDLDGDGTDDLALTGKAGDELVLGVLSGPVGKESRRWLMRFPVAAGRNDALCTATVTMAAENLGLPLAEMGCGADSNDDRCRALKERNTRLQALGTRGGRGVKLDDGKCEPFHVYWDGAEQKLRWWRR